jgi:hypothetical protein
MNLSLQYTISAKFRAFGITFGNFTHSGSVPLPLQPPLTLIEGFIPAKTELVSFNMHGVALSITLVETPAEPAA